MLKQPLDPSGNPPLVHLRVRTEFSFGETFAPVERVVGRLAEMGVTAAGCVDWGTWGHVAWSAACSKAGILPLFGVAVIVVPELSAEDRPTMWMLANSSAGLKELYRLMSHAHRQSVRGTPRLTHEDVRRISSEITIFAGNVLEERLLREVNAVLDLDPGSPIANRKKIALAARTGLRCVAVSDNAYAVPEDRAVYEMIGRQLKPTPQHLLSAAELRAAIPEYNATMATTAATIAHLASTVQLPSAPIIHAAGDLEALCRAGIVERGMEWVEEYEKRLQRELMLIRAKNFESYFLVVADMVRYAKSRMLVGPSRGSAAGSLVCYLTRITEIDPIKARLIFERFIDVTRADLPDIDLDFVDSKRHLVIEYLREKYGARNVAQIGTVSTFQPKSALIAVAKKLNVPPWETNSVKDALFERSSGDSRANFALLDTLEQTDPGRKLLEKYPAMRLSAALEAHASHSGVHAAGILVCNEEVENFCTVTADGVAQLDKKDAEKLNLLKIDVLGLRTLGVLEDTGVEVDWYGMKFDDPEAFRVINEKRYAGIFQFEGPSLQSIAGEMVCESLDDLGHVTALARPGPMSSGGAQSYLLRRAGKEEWSVPHALLAPYVKETHGVVIYQEQVLQICRELGQMSWDDVTLLRKAISKSYGKEYFDQFRDKFVAGAKLSGIPNKNAVEIWEMVNTMGSWAFNLAHSYSYAVVSYWTAWMKAHHPLEFAAASLRNSRSDDSTIALLRELVREGVNWVPFDPENMEANWAVKNGVLYSGFQQLKGIGPSKAAALVAQRASNSGRLPSSVLEDLKTHEVQFADPFPTRSRWGSYYDHPERHNLRKGTRLSTISEIKGEAEFVYIGRMKRKDLRDINETILVKRRNGKKYTGPALFLDMDLEDDTGTVLTRIERFDFEALGRSIWEREPVGTWWLVRGERRLWGKPDGGFKMIYVKKIQKLG